MFDVFTLTESPEEPVECGGFGGSRIVIGGVRRFRDLPF
jgi:hypothetical protein